MKLQTCIVIGLLVCVCCCSTVLAEKPTVSAEKDNLRVDLATAYPNYAIYWSPSTFFVPNDYDWDNAYASNRPLAYNGGKATANIKPDGAMMPLIGVSMPAYLTGSYVPKARHVYLHYKVRSTDLHPDVVQVYNGPTLVFMKIYSPTTMWVAETTYLDDIDMGFYSVFNRGLSIMVVMNNVDTAHNELLDLYGAGVRAEW
jgi:hypothetical protein